MKKPGEEWRSLEKSGEDMEKKCVVLKPAPFLLRCLYLLVYFMIFFGLPSPNFSSLLQPSPAFFPVAHAQMSQEELRRERVESIESLKRTEDISGKSWWVSRGLRRSFDWRLNYGGVFSPTFTSGGDNDRDASAQDSLDHSWEQDLRFFVNAASRSGKTKFYGRVRTAYTRNSRASQSIRRSDWIQPAVDLLYLQRLIQAGVWRHSLTFGRQFVMVERGISFGLSADGLHYEARSRVNEFQAFFVRQNPGDDNVDYLAAGSGRTKRWFYGAEWKIRFFSNQKAGVFALANLDRNDESPDAAGQRHQLDSFYHGLGLDGRIFGNLSYWGQAIRETGKTYPTGGATKVNISAYALDAGLRYFFRTRTSPSFYAEYATGSGDGDASGSAVSTLGGSLAGSDRRFISFGGLSLGYALAPQLVNLDVVKLGMSVKPFAWTASKAWSELSVQPAYYVYRKDKPTGAISDPYSASASRKVGAAFDLTAAWKPAVDISYQLKFGRFNPSSAYANRGSEVYLRFKVSLDL